MFWCDKETGLSPNVWLRSVGWLSMALVEIYETIRDDDPEGAAALAAQLLELLNGMMPLQREGMWYQVFNRPGEENNYLETSGSLMLAFAMMKAARIGMIDAEWREEGVKVYESVLDKFLVEENSEVFLNNICKSAGLGKNPGTGVIRDGSYEYYTTGEPIVPNNGHGVGALFVAENEYLLARWK